MYQQCELDLSSTETMIYKMLLKHDTYIIMSASTSQVHIKVITFSNIPLVWTQPQRFQNVPRSLVTFAGMLRS